MPPALPKTVSPAAVSKAARVKIAFVYLGFYRNAGGERTIYQLVRGLDRTRYDISIITLRANTSEIGRRLEALGVRVIKLDQPLDQPLPSPRRPLALIKSFRAIYGTIRRLQPHILQAQGKNLNSLARLVALAARVPVIISVENFVYPPRPSGVRALEHWLKDRLIIALDRRSQAIIAVAKAFIDEKVRMGARTPCALIPSPLDLQAFLRGRSVRPLAAPLQDPNRIRLGFLGRLSPGKGARYAIQALARVRKVYPQAELVIIGSGPEEAILRDFAASQGLQGQVTFRGQREDVCGELCRLDIFLMPSLREAYGLVLLEAMAAGLPIVATRTVGSKEVFPDGLQQDLVDPADAAGLAAQILKMLRDPEDARAQAAALHAHGSEISCEKRYIRSHDKLYRDLIAAHVRTT